MSQVGAVTLEDFIFGGAPQVLSRYFQGNSKVWPSLFVRGYYLTEWRVGLSSGWKHKILDRMNTVRVHYFLLEGVAFGDLLCFPGIVFGGGSYAAAERSWSRWWGLYFFHFFFVSFSGCVHPEYLCDLLLVQRLGVISIFVILIYSPFQKKYLMFGYISGKTKLCDYKLNIMFNV